MKIIKTERLHIFHLSEINPSDMVYYFLKNQDHFAPTNPPLPEDFYTTPFWEERIKISLSEYSSDTAIRLVLTENDNPKTPIGTVNITQIFRGPFQAAFLGYGLDQNHQGKGYMLEALKAVIHYSFGQLNLHRLMANYLPENIRSAQLLKKLNFIVEGKAYNYLFINGEWRDHILTALTNPHWTSNKVL